MLNKIIAIDYDDTISLNKEAWEQIINLFSSLGAIVYVVTYRHSTQFDDIDLNIPNVKDYIFTNATAKRKYCEEVASVEVDIWIDDMPESIVFDYKELIENMKIK
jgi:hypothetical protein